MARRKSRVVVYEPGEEPKKRARGAKVEAGAAEVVADESPVDQRLVEEAVKEIRKRYDSAVEGMFEKGNLGMLDIGRYVLEHFYGGDPEKASARGRKPASLRELAEHPDMPLGKTQLNSVVRAAALEQRLLTSGTKQVKQLQASHLIEILRAPDDKRRKALVEETVEKGLSVRQLQERIAQLSTKALPAPAAEGTDEGRTRIPRPLLTFLKLDMDRLANKERLARLPKRQLTRYRKTLEEAAARIRALLKALGQAEA